MENRPIFIYHLTALLTSMIWGSTFVASKVLLNAGMTPAEIMILRFVIAYLLMLPFCHKDILSRTWRDELLFVIMGLSGGSLYFLAENTALQITRATSTVALLVCTTPILTALCAKIIWRDTHLPRSFFAGSSVALIGVTFVIFNGVFILDDNPLVVALSIGASLLWAVYSLALRVLERRYKSSVIARKVFFWGIITLLPYFLFFPVRSDAAILMQPAVVGNILFLALIASFGCYLLWNIAIRKIGVVHAGNYLYFNPVVSLLTAAVVLDEEITTLAAIGCGLTIIGVYWANRKS